MEPWQSISILPPPVQTTQRKDNIDVLGLRHACDNILRVLSKQSPLHREGALLSRFIYKYNKKFRNDIGYRNIRKTNSTLRKYLQVNLSKDVENFTAVLPNEDEDFLPTRQMLEYILSRIITFSKLMLRVYMCSKQAAVFYLDRVKKGESHWMSLMPYALLSRIWSISAVLLQHATSWYSCLHSYLTHLQPKGLGFLPDNYILPLDLNEWLDLKNLDAYGKVDWSQRKIMNVGLDMLEDQEGDIFDSILDYASHINDENKETGLENSSFIQELNVDFVPKDQLLLVSNNKIDYGQAISRDSFKTSSTSQEIKDVDQQQVSSDTKGDQRPTVSKESCKILTNFQKKISNANKDGHYFGKVTNGNTLKQFLDREEMYRNDGNKLSLTKHLSFMQWHTLKTSLVKVCESILNNRKIERKLLKEHPVIDCNTGDVTRKYYTYRCDNFRK